MWQAEVVEKHLLKCLTFERGMKILQTHDLYYQPMNR